jgi:hypothetical protein
MEFIEPYLNSIKPINIGKIEKPKQSKAITPVYAFGDAHIGKINTDAVIKRIQIMSDEIINDPSNKIVMIDL